MTKGISISMFNLDGLSLPANTLVEKISSAIGGELKPRQIERVAKARATAALIEADTTIEISARQRRALHRFVEEESLRQDNMDSITAQAIPLLGKKADPAAMDDDWITSFFDKARLVSTEEMQRLRANVLAGEANAPGTISKRTLRFLCDLEQREAELFVALCGFGWTVEKFRPLVFDVPDTLYAEQGIDFDTLAHLDSIGLIRYYPLAEIHLDHLPPSLRASYHEAELALEVDEGGVDQLYIGHVELTRIGEELATMCKPPKVDGFYEYVTQQWKPYLASQDPGGQGGTVDPLGP